MIALAQLLTYFTRRRVIAAAGWFCLLFVFLHILQTSSYGNLNVFFGRHSPVAPLPSPNLDDGKFHWQNVPIQHPVPSLTPLPIGRPKPIPRIQSQKPHESSEARAVRLQRLGAVKEALQHAWKGYKDHAWMSDEVGPLSGSRNNAFGGWAASLVDALDTLWIMGLKSEFEEAVAAIEVIDFTTTDLDELNTFETTIRYLGGFLSAYDLSKGEYPVLLYKAVELGEMLLISFDTPNRMPITRWDWRKARDGSHQEASEGALVAEVGSLTLEFTRLSQITGDPRFYDAVQRVMDVFHQQQMTTKLPGMWPITINARDLDFGSDTAYTLGAMSDSLYEYLPKTHCLLGGLTDQYEEMYTRSANTFKEHNFFRPMTKDNADILFSGLARAHDDGTTTLDYSMQHLVCFAGGMVAIGARIFNREDELEIARRLVDGCIWAYGSLDNELMVEVSHHVPCDSTELCEWDEEKWYKAVLARNSGDDDHGSSDGASDDSEKATRIIQEQRLKPGYVDYHDTRYILRPEAIESVFIWYRVTGDSTYQDKAWKMFEAIENHTRTDIANAALDDVTSSPPSMSDRMESFWMAETLKYFYLIFADTELISLDDYVFNTEAHPFLRPKS